METPEKINRHDRSAVDEKYEERDKIGHLAVTTDVLSIRKREEKDQEISCHDGLAAGVTTERKDREICCHGGLAAGKKRIAHRLDRQ